MTYQEKQDQRNEERLREYEHNQEYIRQRAPEIDEKTRKHIAGAAVELREMQDNQGR